MRNISGTTEHTEGFIFHLIRRKWRLHARLWYFVTTLLLLAYIIVLTALASAKPLGRPNDDTGTVRSFAAATRIGRVGWSLWGIPRHLEIASMQTEPGMSRQGRLRRRPLRNLDAPRAIA